MPVIRAEALLRKLDPGARLKILADDPLAAVDIPHFCRLAGHTVERLEAADEICVFLVTRAEKLAETADVALPAPKD